MHNCQWWIWRADFFLDKVWKQRNKLLNFLCLSLIKFNSKILFIPKLSKSLAIFPNVLVRTKIGFWGLFNLFKFHFRSLYPFFGLWFLLSCWFCAETEEDCEQVFVRCLYIRSDQDVVRSMLWFLYQMPFIDATKLWLLWVYVLSLIYNAH